MEGEGFVRSPFPKFYSCVKEISVEKDIYRCCSTWISCESEKDFMILPCINTRLILPATAIPPACDASQHTTLLSTGGPPLDRRLTSQQPISKGWINYCRAATITLARIYPSLKEYLTFISAACILSTYFDCFP